MSDFRWWLVLARPHAKWFLLAAFCSLAMLLANMALMAVAGWFLASMAAAGAAGLDFNYYTPAAIIRGLAIIRTGGRYAERLIGHDATLRLLTTLRVWFYRQVEPLSMLDLQQLHSGDLLDRIRKDIDTLDHVYLRLIMPMAVAVVAGFIVVIVLSLFSWAVAVVGLAFLLVAGWVLPMVTEALGRTPGRSTVEFSSAMKETAVEALDGLGELTVFGGFAGYRQSIEQMGRQWVRTQGKLANIHGLSAAGMVLVINLAVLVSAWLLVPPVREGRLSAVDFAPILLLVMACFEAVISMPDAWQAFGQMQAATRRLRAFEALQPVDNGRRARAEPLSDSLIFDQLTVRYPPGKSLALDRVSATILAGQHVAIVGPSGSGKTTLVSTLLGLIRPQEGRVLWDGRPLDAYCAEGLRRRLAVVPQHVYLFHTTVRENLLVGNPEASEAELRAAAECVGIHDEILAFPDGYDTIVGEEGMRLSGGQVKRIGIARALLRRAPIVVMDEPTEGLDAKAEARLWPDLSRHFDGCTLLLISHRMAWVRQIPHVLVMEGGVIVASGSHTDLMRSSSVYRRLSGGEGVLIAE